MSITPRRQLTAKSLRRATCLATLALGVLLPGAALAQLGDGGFQTWDQDLVPGTTTGADDRFGDVFAVGDFNGDGFQDLAVSEPRTTVDGDVNAGLVHVFYYLPLFEAFWPSRVQTFDLSQWQTGGTDFSNAFFGKSLAAGDFDGDGYDDLAIGAPLASVEFNRGGSLAQEAGVVCVVFGSSSDLDIAERQTLNDDIVDDFEWFGWALAVGRGSVPDADDLWIGVPRQGVEVTGPVIAEAGAIKQFGGSPVAPLTYVATLIQEAFPGGDSDPFDWFGEVMVPGDFDGDGRLDVAIGAPQDNIGAADDAGAVFVKPATNQLPFLMIDQSQIAAVSPETSDHFGAALAAGDFDGNGYDDLAIGVPDEDVSGNSLDDAGLVHLFLGTESGITLAGSEFLEQGDSGAVAMTEAGDRFGAALTAGDFDGDGYDELIVGAPGEDLNSDTISNAGAAVRFFGSDSGITTTGADLWTQSSPFAAEANEPDDFASSSLAVGDFNGDGGADLVIGIPSEDDGAAVDAGAFVVYYSGGLEIFRDGFESGDTAEWSATSP